MKIKLVLPEQEADYIRRARTETLNNLGEEVTAAAVEPTPFAFYFVAYDEKERPIGMAEIALLDQVYGSFPESPYAGNFDMTEFGPISEFAGIRTIFVEPEYRHKAGSIYLQLVLAGARLVSALGVTFGTATTVASDQYLGRLYEKTGGRAMGNFRNGGSESDIAFFVFRIDDLINHKLIKRMAASLDLEIKQEIVDSLMARSPLAEERKCA